MKDPIHYEFHRQVALKVADLISQYAADHAGRTPPESCTTVQLSENTQQRAWQGEPNSLNAAATPAELRLWGLPITTNPEVPPGEAWMTINYRTES